MQYDRTSFYIGGEWREPASGETFAITNPSTEEVIATVPKGSKQDIDAAVSAAREAFDTGPWGRMDRAERAAIMEKFLGAMAARGEQLAQAVSMQNGMPITLSSQLEGQFAAGVLQYYTQLAKAPLEPDVRPSQMGKETLVESAPRGVVAAIVPWNFPVSLAMNKIAPAMAAGCALVIKPSPGTILDSYILAEAAEEAGVPPGVLNWVAADREVGAQLVSHSGIDKVAFTGSTAAGRKIAATCGEMLRPVTLELGGKSAAILLEDADLQSFLQAVPFASMLNNGQACYNSTRILAPRARYDEVVDGLAGFVDALSVGDALDPETHVGPMASREHQERVLGYIQKGKEEARLVTGGNEPAGPNRGFFVAPTVFADVRNDAVIAREEIFGPVLAVIAYDGEDDAVRIANDTSYGLGGSVFSKDSEHALDVARRVASGTVGVNGYMPSLGAPFGGIKDSGMGREFGPEAIGAYQTTKSLYIMG